MTHQTYYVTVVAVIPVLAIASILEIRTTVSAIADSDWPQWRKELTMLYWAAQALVTALLLVLIPGILDALYNQREPHDHTMISWGLTVMVTMVAFMPFTGVMGTLMDVTTDSPVDSESQAARRPHKRSLPREARRLAGRR